MRTKVLNLKSKTSKRDKKRLKKFLKANTFFDEVKQEKDFNITGDEFLLEEKIDNYFNEFHENKKKSFNINDKNKEKKNFISENKIKSFLDNKEEDLIEDEVRQEINQASFGVKQNLKEEQIPIYNATEERKKWEKITGKKKKKSNEKLDEKLKELGFDKERQSIFVSFKNYIKRFFENYFNFKKSIALFLVISLIISSPLYLLVSLKVTYGQIKKDQNLEVNDLVNNYLQASDNLKKGEYQKAKSNLMEGDKLLDNIEKNILNKFGILTTMIDVFPISNKVTTLKNIFDALKKTTELGISITDELGNKESFNDIEKESLFQDGFLEMYEKEGGEKNNIVDDNKISGIRGISQDIKILLGEIDYLYLKVKAIDKDLDKVNPSDVEEYEYELSLVKDFIKEIKNILLFLKEKKNLFMHILGNDGQKNFLVIYQNPSEIRATGGFIGSFSLLEVDNGLFDIPKVEGVYDIDNQLTQKIIPPKPLGQITGNWSMHDSNWFFDFPTSAEQIKLFYEKTGSSSVDGVIALNTEILTSFLDITGVVKVTTASNEEVEISSDNFYDLVQREVENQGQKGDSKPKKILSKLLPAIINKLFSKNIYDLVSLPSLLINHFNNKNILINLTNEKYQKEIIDMNWGGKLKENTNDYLAIVHSNIGGAKTDRYMEEEVDLTSEIKEGYISNALTIKRSHLGVGSELDWWYKTENRDYLRIYVPKGSKLKDVSGFDNIKFNDVDYSEYPDFKKSDFLTEYESSYEVDSEKKIETFLESGKRVFGGWLIIKPGEEREVKITYEVPYSSSIFNSFSFYKEIQAGINENSFNYNLKLGNYNKVKEYSIDNKFIGNNYFKGLILQKKFDNDKRI